MSIIISMRVGGEKTERAESGCVQKRAVGPEPIELFKLSKGNEKSNQRRKRSHFKLDPSDIHLSALKKNRGHYICAKEQLSSEQRRKRKEDSKEAVYKKKQRKKKRKNRTRNKLELDEASRLRKRTRYLLIKMKLEQNLIDAYSMEGWKGQSREKIRPEKELQRARKQIFECKLGIRDVICQLDKLSSVGSIEEKVIAPDGSVHHEHIFCANCKLREAFPDNDILLCDGTCNRAFHQKCLDPPLDTEKIPPGDQAWFCKFCLCKMDIIEEMNAHIGTHFPLDSNWQDIFLEEAAFNNSNCGLLDAEGDWPSDDSQDDDYDPDKWKSTCNVGGLDTDVDLDESVSTSLSWSSDDNPLVSEMLECVGNDRGNLLGSHIESYSDGEVICGRRQRTAVDYKKLYDEMFGKDALLHEQLSEDEDWGPRKRRRKKGTTDGVGTLTTPGDEKLEVEEKLPSDEHVKRPGFRIPRGAVEKLRQVFAEDELPSRIVKENLSKELGLEPEKVSKWFKNARYMALKTRKTEGERQSQNSVKYSNEEQKVKEAPLEDVVKGSDSRNQNTSTDKMNSERFQIASYHATKSNQHWGDSVADEELGEDDVSLKKLIKPKKVRGKKKNGVGTSGIPTEFEVAMESLCRSKNRVEDMRHRILRLKNERSRKLGEKCCLLEDSAIMYLPFAELKEKVLTTKVTDFF